MDENLEWLTQKTEDSKSNKGNLTFPTHTVNVIELSGNKKVATPHFYINPPFQIYPPFLAKNFCNPPSDSIFGRSYPPTPLIREGRGAGVPTMYEQNLFDISFIRRLHVYSPGL